MSIDCQARKIIWECDSCNETFESEEGEEFETAWAKAKREGWKTKKVAGEWLHGCPRHGI